MSHVFPAMWWGSVENPSSWSQTGTCAVTGSAGDPFNGSTAYLLEDNDAGAAEARYVEYTAATTGYHAACIPVAPYGANQDITVQFENRTLGTSGSSTLTFASWVPTQATAGTGAKTYVALGGAYYALRILQYATAGNTMRVTIYPAGSTAGNSGACKVYLRNLCLLDVLDQPVAWEEPREGSAWVQGASGTEDAWIQGTDYHFAGSVRWVPKADRDTPASVSGWGLPNERTAVNTGVAALLRAGRQKDTLFFMPDRIQGFSIYGVSCVLVDPIRGEPEVLPNGDRAFRLHLRASTPFQAVETE